MGADYPAFRAVVGVLVVVLLVFAIGGYSVKKLQQNAECEGIGGTYLRNGKYADPTCIKDGKIVIIWQGTKKIENP